MICGSSISFPTNEVNFPNHCWWKKSCTTWDVWNLVNNGIFSISTGAGFPPSTVGLGFGMVWVSFKCPNCSYFFSIYIYNPKKQLKKKDAYGFRISNSHFRKEDNPESAWSIINIVHVTFMSHQACSARKKTCFCHHLCPFFGFFPSPIIQNQNYEPLCPPDP